MTPPRNLDWESLLVRLTARAILWFRDRHCYGADAVLPGTAKSATELARNAALEFFKGEKVKWRPKTPDEDPYPLIVEVMRNDFLDLVKKSETKQTVILDATRNKADYRELELVRDSNDGFVSAEAASLARSLYPLIKGDQKLKDYIDAVCLCGLRKREDIAELLGITPREVTDLQRRLNDESIYALLKAEQRAEQHKRRANV